MIGERGLGFPKARGVERALYVTHFLVGCGELALQVRITGRFLRQAIEVSERVFQNRFARFERAFEIFDLGVNLEQIGIGQLAHVVKTPLRPSLFQMGETRLPERGHHAAEDGEKNERRREHASLVPAHEFSGAIGEGVAPREHRAAFEVAPDIF